VGASDPLQDGNSACLCCSVALVPRVREVGGLPRGAHRVAERFFAAEHLGSQTPFAQTRLEDDRDGQPSGERGHGLLCPQAVAAHDVGDRDGGEVIRESLSRLGALRRERTHLVGGPMGVRMAEQIDDCCVLIHSACAAAPRYQGSEASVAAGSVKLKVLPSPGLPELSTATSPPSLLTMRFTMDSPKPCPLVIA